MNEMLLKYWILTTGFLAVKMWANSIVQVFCRFKYRAFVNEEDAQQFGAILKTQLIPVKAEHPMVERAALCWRNDLENIPLFLIIALGYVLVGGDTTIGLVYFTIYSLSRALHTIFYLNRLQPWRTIAYQVSSITMVVMLVHSIWQAFR